MIRARIFEYFRTYDQTKTQWPLQTSTVYSSSNIFFSLFPPPLPLFSFFFSFFPFFLQLTNDKILLSFIPLLLINIITPMYFAQFMWHVSSKQPENKLSIFSTLSLLNLKLQRDTSLLPHFPFMDFKSKTYNSIIRTYFNIEIETETLSLKVSNEIRNWIQIYRNWHAKAEQYLPRVFRIFIALSTSSLLPILNSKKLREITIESLMLSDMLTVAFSPLNNENKHTLIIYKRQKLKTLSWG